MNIQPIRVVESVLDEYQSYLETEFRARDPKLREALEDALKRPHFLAQEPFYQAHRPFKTGQAWQSLGLDAALAAAMEARTDSKHAYIHQSQAIKALTGDEARPVVVTTGTGSGKTECFLLPIIQNAIEDAAAFKGRPGLTALLIYPMNALANDQEERINALLAEANKQNIRVARYDRTTPSDVRKELRRKPPHILLTNYMMLEYLLVRPEDRGPLFRNHRCRYLVLDEVHSYRGTLGSNIALLTRRVSAHLKSAVHDWGTDEPSNKRRFPNLIPVATSATIKSLDESDLNEDELKLKREQAVQEFLQVLTGTPGSDFLVLSEEIRDLSIPEQAQWTAVPTTLKASEVDAHDANSVAGGLRSLCGAGEDVSVEEAAKRCAALWVINERLARKPMSLSDLVNAIAAEVPERQNADRKALRGELELALIVGAALPEKVAGSLQLRAHRFVRGGWRFHRCVDPDCGRIYARGEDQCECGFRAAPLYLCRSCGVDVQRFQSHETKPNQLEPFEGRGNEGEWLLYDQNRYGEEAVGFLDVEKMKGRKVVRGSFNPQSLSFSLDPELYPMKAILAPSRNRCLMCGFMAGAGSILTSVSLGTSAAVRVMSEGLVEALADQHARHGNADNKERLLIFSDSRQDAAHQARFITYAGRYDRMRRRVIEVLEKKTDPQSLSDILLALLERGVAVQDNPHVQGFDDADFLSKDVRARAEAWEEAPLLDDIAVSSGYRATIFNLGLVEVKYQKLDKFISKYGEELCDRFKISPAQLSYIARCMLDELRRRMAFSRELLRYHPESPSCPKQYGPPADWERRFRAPQGYVCDEKGDPVPWLAKEAVPAGITRNNFLKKKDGAGRSPAFQRRFSNLIYRMGGQLEEEEELLDIVRLLMKGPKYIESVKLYGHKQSRKLLQVNAEAVDLALVKDEDRRRCNLCHASKPGAPVGYPCPICPGSLVHLDCEEVNKNRYVQRIRKSNLMALNAGEHTAQVTGERRLQLEEAFKAAASVSPVNVLACSPTLEMGIDVGGLDAVVMRNVPPRPDNYAQRGGRAGRRSRVGIVLSYTRSTPHDAYFFDKPTEMIAGEVPAPAVSLGNKDVIKRHLIAIALGSAKPGLAGKMGDYISLKGELNDERIEELIEAINEQAEGSVKVAMDAWGESVLLPADLFSEVKLKALFGEALRTRLRDVFERVAFQIQQLQAKVAVWAEMGQGDSAAMNAMSLSRRLLGFPDEGKKSKREADDRTSGHPMRRFAEFGILPGYEFPSEPATVRLLRDDDEEHALSVARRFGISQYQPEARAHARGHRWRVVGLDVTSPWNPKGSDPSWVYIRCQKCKLRRDAQRNICPRCGSTDTKGGNLKSYAFGGFLARRDDRPVLEEEDRFSMSARIQCYPQWNGDCVYRFRCATGWRGQLRRGEDVYWLNEGPPPSKTDEDEERPVLHSEARGFYLCQDCGQTLTFPSEKKKAGSRKLSKGKGACLFGHSSQCPSKGKAPKPMAIVAKVPATTLRVVVTLPENMSEEDYQIWGLSLGYALRSGMRQLYMLDGSEIEFILEPKWTRDSGGQDHDCGALTFLDNAVGGSGFLKRAAKELHLVAKRALEHLDHEGCLSACYRCLKSYRNQRFHDFLNHQKIRSHLEGLSSKAPKELDLKIDDIEDPKPWLEAYKVGVGSPLEHRFLKLFEDHGLEVELQQGVAPNPGEDPISVTDFRITGSRVLIYVDGAAFHVGKQLRRDKEIRKKLESGLCAWKVVALKVGDLKGGKELVDELKSLANAHPNESEVSTPAPSSADVSSTSPTGIESDDSDQVKTLDAILGLCISDEERALVKAVFQRTSLPLPDPKGECSVNTELEPVLSWPDHCFGVAVVGDKKKPVVTVAGDWRIFELPESLISSAVQEAVDLIAAELFPEED